MELVARVYDSPSKRLDREVSNLHSLRPFSPLPHHEKQKMVTASRLRPWTKEEEDQLWRVSEKKGLKFDSRT